MSPFTGPSDETLRKLSGMLPSFVEGLAQKRAIGKGQKVPKPIRKVPSKICKVCAVLFDLQHPSDKPIEPGICLTCEALIKEGYVALISGEQYAFVKSERLKDLPDRIVHLQPGNMEKIKNEFEANWKTREGG